MILYTKVHIVVNGCRCGPAKERWISRAAKNAAWPAMSLRQEPATGRTLLKSVIDFPHGGLI
jgi:hypothetical protein